MIESKYNERRKETETALKLLQSRLNIQSLADVSIAQFEQNADLLPAVIRKRALHVVRECDRVHQAVQALKEGNMVKLGQLLNESHASLRDLFEVTGVEPDALVAIAQSHRSCVGSRLTGGGFGGSTISIVKSDDVDDFKTSVFLNYFKTTGYMAKFYDVQISDGLTITKL